MDTLDKVNKMSKSDFISIFGNVFEKTTWIAEKVYNLRCKGCRENHRENVRLARRCIVTCGIFNLEIIILLVVLLVILFSNLL